MKKTSLQDKNIAHRVSEDALLLAAALILSFVESLFPISALIPLPGFKLGLSNIAITAAAYRLSSADAAAVSFAKVIVLSLLFGSITSFFFSLAGASFVILALIILKRVRVFSFIGISVICAASHNLGQLTAAAIVFGKAALSYFPVLLFASVIFGGICGIILNILPRFIFEEKHIK